MSTPEEKEAARKQLMEVRKAYDTLFELRMLGKVPSGKFSKRSSSLERQSAHLRTIIGINTMGVGGVFCHECGEFFTGPHVKENVESFDSCYKHRSGRIIQVPHPLHN